MKPQIDEERAAILEHCGGMNRTEAERRAVVHDAPVLHMMVRYALAYARRGWRVFPCAGKLPRIKEWQLAATTDEAQIRAWWKRWPTADIGVATGEESGIYVLDVDPAKGGDKSLLKLVDRTGPIEYVAHCITGSGGDHYYRQHPGGHVANGANVFGPELPGLDIRGDGGFVVAPPSLHANGERYSWGSRP